MKSAKGRPILESRNLSCPRSLLPLPSPRPVPDLGVLCLGRPRPPQLPLHRAVVAALGELKVGVHRGSPSHLDSMNRRECHHAVEFNPLVSRVQNIKKPPN